MEIMGLAESVAGTFRMVDPSSGPVSGGSRKFKRRVQLFF